MSIHSNLKVLFLSFALCLSSNAWGLGVVIDPGHGGIDTGAVRGSIKESELVLKVAQKVRKLLQEDSQFTSFMTRESDHQVSLPDRIKLAENWGGDIFVSLHANTAPDSRARGLEVFFQNSLPPDEESLYLASLENQTQNLQETSESKLSRSGDLNAIVQDLHRQSKLRSSLELSKILQTNLQQTESIAIKQAPYYVITKSKMPSILIELGFLTHPKEVQKLSSPLYQEELAKKIYTALVQYKEKMDSQEPQALK